MLTLTDQSFHAARTRFADWCNAARRVAALSFLERGEDQRALREHGFVAVRDFLPETEFHAVRNEAVRALEKAEQEVPVRHRTEMGFGDQEPHSWGFDRYDGGTLNRFIDIDHVTMPSIAVFSRNSRITGMCRAGLGTIRSPRRVMIYLTVHGDEQSNHDIQKDLHRDSFYRKIKYWYFLDAVEDSDGPFEYVPGSHRLTRRRLAWEAEQAARLGVPGTIKDSAYRISVEELHDLDLPGPVALKVPANSLVIADTFGFHRRGDAVAGSRRLSIYAQKRPWPFTPIGF